MAYQNAEDKKVWAKKSTQKKKDEYSQRVARGDFIKCNDCGISKSIAEFYTYSTTYCKVCIRLKSKGRDKDIKNRQGRIFHRKYRYGLTEEQFDKKMLDQNGVCAICSQPPAPFKDGRDRALYVDHDHDTGEVRGLICQACNTALGFLKDSSKLARIAADYLERYGK